MDSGKYVLSRGEVYGIVFVQIKRGDDMVCILAMSRAIKLRTFADVRSIGERTIDDGGENQLFILGSTPNQNWPFKDLDSCPFFSQEDIKFVESIKDEIFRDVPQGGVER